MLTLGRRRGGEGGGDCCLTVYFGKKNLHPLLYCPSPPTLPPAGFVYWKVADHIFTLHNVGWSNCRLYYDKRQSTAQLAASCDSLCRMSHGCVSSGKDFAQHKWSKDLTHLSWFHSHLEWLALISSECMPLFNKYDWKFIHLIFKWS